MSFCNIQSRYLVAAGLDAAQAKHFIAELRGGARPSSAAPAAVVREGSVGSASSAAPRALVECPAKFKTIAAALGRIGCSALLERFISEEIDDEMLGDLEQEHIVDLGMSVQQCVARIYLCISFVQLSCYLFCHSLFAQIS
jgi:hypothetical protein